MKPARRPFLVTLFFSLLAGAGFSIALAVACAAWSDAKPALQAIRNKAFTHSPWDTDFGTMLTLDPHAAARFDRLLTLEQTVWTPRSGASEFSTLHSVTVSVGPGFEVEEFTSTFHYTTETGGAGYESAGVLSYRAGWPFKCLRTHQWSPNGPPIRQAMSARALQIGPGQTPASPLPWFHAADYPAFLIDPNSTVERKVPLVPAWPGLLANTAIYAGLILLTFPVRHAVVRWNRRRRNHCLVCNYDRRGLEPSDRCPECGTTDEPRSSSR